MNKTEYLNEVLETHKMSKIQVLLDKYSKKQLEIKNAITEHYGSNIYSIFMSGSFAKHTAINIKFDMDIVVPFKRNSFKTLQDMFDDIYEFLNEKYHNIGEVRKQKVSIGIIFQEDSDGDQIQIDVVPGRELSSGNYRETNDLNLCFNEDLWGFKKGTTWMKTNIQSQIENISGKKNERKIIRLLKIWKKNYNKAYKSFMLELFVIKAFESYSENGTLWDKLKYAMQYIADNIKEEDFKLIDPGNSNNDVLESVEHSQKDELSNDLNYIINAIARNEECLKIYFKINEEFQDIYKDRGFGDNVISYPPTGKRFG